MLHNPSAHENLNLPVPASHSEYEGGQARDVRAYGMHDALQHRLRFPIPGSVQAFGRLLERERPRHLFLETRGHEHHHRSRRYIPKAV